MRCLAVLCFFLLASCKTAQKMEDCQDLESTMFNQSHDQFYLDVCTNKIYLECKPGEGDCIGGIYYQCVQELLELKVEQVRQYRAQSCYLRQESHNTDTF